MKCEHCGHEWTSQFEHYSKSPESMAVLIDRIMKSTGDCGACPAQKFCEDQYNADQEKGVEEKRKCKAIIIGWLQSDVRKKRKD